MDEKKKSRKLERKHNVERSRVCPDTVNDDDCSSVTAGTLSVPLVTVKDQKGTRTPTEDEH